MGDVGITNCSLYHKLEGDLKETFIVTPSSADSNDTVDVSTLFADYNVLYVDGFDKTTGDLVTATIAPSTGVITIDASGGTTNHVYVIRVVGFGKVVYTS